MKLQRRQPRVNGEDRLAEIYKIAAQIICEKGFDATSMNDIAEAVGITKAGIYHYIPGKKELLFEIMSYGMDKLEHMVIAPARAIADPEERLRAIIANHCRVITGGITPQGYNAVTIVVDEVAALTPAHRRKIVQRKRAYVDLVRNTLKQLKEEGKLKDVDITVGAFSLLGMILWLSRWYRPEGRLQPDQVGEELTKMALGGFLRPSARFVAR